MLSDQEIAIWYHKQGFKSETQEIIDKIRKNPPARLVQGKRKNVCGNYPSMKMGLTIQFESHRVELPRIFELEFDPNTLEYFDQPYGGIELFYLSKNNKKVRHNHTPDFFVIKEDGAGWEECKPEQELEKLAKTQPNRYLQDENGTWRCPPGEDVAARLGLSYTIYSDKKVSWVFQENIGFLEDYYRFAYPEIKQEIINTVKKIVEDQRGISLADLLAADTGATSDDIYALIASQTIYIDLCQSRLSNPHEVRVFQNRDMAIS